MGDRYGQKFRFVNYGQRSQRCNKQFKASLGNILKNESPDLLTAPTDIPEVGKVVIQGYEQHVSAFHHNTVLLYKADRITVKDRADMPTCSFPGVDNGQMFCPEVQLFYKGAREPSRTFTLVTWNYEMTVNSNMDRTKQTQGLVAFSQHVAQMRQHSLLLGGDFNADAATVQNVLKFMNNRAQNKFMNEASEDFDSTFLPSMIMGSTRELRNMFRIEMHKVSDNQFFLASKDMQFDPPKIATSSSVGGLINRQPNTNPVIGPELPPHMQSMPFPVTQAPVQSVLNMQPTPGRFTGG